MKTARHDDAEEARIGAHRIVVDHAGTGLKVDGEDMAALAVADVSGVRYQIGDDGIRTQ